MIMITRLSVPFLVPGFVIVLIALSVFTSCEPQPESEDNQPLTIDFSDTTFISLWYAQVRKDTAMIQSYLDSEDPMRQYAALMALSTTPSPHWTTRLVQLLNAPQKQIRTRAAFSLGQSGDASALSDLKNAFNNKDSLMQDQHFNATVLEAVGKLGGPREAIELISTRTYSPRDSILNLGRLRALYQIALNGHELKEVQYFMMDVIGQALHPGNVRYLAADYLARFPSEPFDSLQFSVIRAFERTEDIQFKRQLARLLPNCSATKANTLLVSILADREADATLRLLCGRAVLETRPSESASYFRSLLEDEDPAVSQLAASYFLRYGNPHDAVDYGEWAKKGSLPKSTRIVLLSAAMEHLPFYYQLSKNNIAKELLAFWPQEMTRADRKVIISRLAGSETFFDDLVQFARETNDEIVRTDILLGLQQEYCNAEEGCTFSRNQLKMLTPLLRDALQKETGSQTISAEIATALGAGIPESWSAESSFVLAAYDSLELPRQLEAAEAMETLMDTLSISYEKREISAPVEPHTRIWQRMTDSTRLVLELPQGKVQITFLPREAPLTVAQIIAEVESGYYEGKSWHRVVPHFVVQTGCPTGHGYDSGDSLLPTETSPYAHYDAAGACGMASIGPHTESTQWFITLRATPHLDGKYTKWGQVTSGKELLETIRAGDQIRSLYIENLSI
jgi:cyclophilin family peptidyl-prolyl cis-trans isomerase/HEAT repeat protein